MSKNLFLNLYSSLNFIFLGHLFILVNTVNFAAQIYPFVKQTCASLSKALTLILEPLILPQLSLFSFIKVPIGIFAFTSTANSQLPSQKNFRVWHIDKVDTKCKAKCAENQ
jgi:hypothetical protein